MATKPKFTNVVGTDVKCLTSATINITDPKDMVQVGGNAVNGTLLIDENMNAIFKVADLQCEECKAAIIAEATAPVKAELKKAKTPVEKVETKRTKPYPIYTGNETGVTSMYYGQKGSVAIRIEKKLKDFLGIDEEVLTSEFTTAIKEAFEYLVGINS